MLFPHVPDVSHNKVNYSSACYRMKFYTDVLGLPCDKVLLFVLCECHILGSEKQQLRIKTKTLRVNKCFTS